MYPILPSEFMTMTRSASASTRDVGVVRNEDHLALFLEALYRIDHGFIDEMVVEVVFRLVDDQRILGSRQQQREESRALLPAREFRSVLEDGLRARRHIELDAHDVVNLNNFQLKRIDVGAESGQDLLRALRAEPAGLIETNMVISLDELCELFGPKLQQRSEDFVMIADAGTFQALRQQVSVREVIGVPENAHTDLIAGFPRQVTCDRIPKRRYLFAF